MYYDITPFKPRLVELRLSRPCVRLNGDTGEPLSDGGWPPFTPPTVKLDTVTSVCSTCPEEVMKEYEDSVSREMVPPSYEYRPPRVVICGDAAADGDQSGKLYIRFTRDVNLVKVHKEVCNHIAHKVERAKEYIATGYKRAADAEAKRSATVSTVEINRAMDEAKTILDESVSFLESCPWEEYMRLAMPYIEKYTSLAGDEVSRRVFYMFSEDSPAEADAVVSERIDLILRYVNSVACKFMDIDCIYKHNGTVAASTVGGEAAPSSSGSAAACIMCGAGKSALNRDPIHGTIVCECGVETIGVSSGATFRDAVRIDASSRQNYEDLMNFVKRIDAFEGKQKAPPPDLLYTQLREYLSTNHGMDCYAVAEMDPIDERGRRPGTSVALLGDALAATNNTAYYRDSDIIANRIWNWPLPDVTSSGIRKKLIHDYIATQMVYNEIKRRESSLNVNNRLFFHLKAVGYPCNIRDFKSITSKPSNQYHWEMFKVMAERCDIPFDKEWWSPRD